MQTRFEHPANLHGFPGRYPQRVTGCRRPQRMTVCTSRSGNKLESATSIRQPWILRRVICLNHCNMDTDVDYWSDARTPLSSLLFLLPWIAAYEAGILLIAAISPIASQRGRFLDEVVAFTGGIGQLLLPVLVICSLLIWHIAQKYPWRFRLDTLAGMFAESLLLAVGLVAVGQLHDFIFRQLNGEHRTTY